MTNFTASLKSRGLAFVDDGSAVRAGGGIPRASADRIVDGQLSGEAIQQQLGALEAQASRTGRALGSGFAYPVTLDEAASGPPVSPPAATSWRRPRRVMARR